MVSMGAIRTLFISGFFKNLRKPEPNRMRELKLNNQLSSRAISAVDLPTTPFATLAGSISSSRTRPWLHDRTLSFSQDTILLHNIPVARTTQELAIHEVRRCLASKEIKY